MQSPEINILFDKLGQQCHIMYMNLISEFEILINNRIKASIRTLNIIVHGIMLMSSKLVGVLLDRI